VPEVSTRTSIAYRSAIEGGSGFHLYFDFADGNVHLTLTEVGLEPQAYLDFEATPNELRVRLPREVLDAIVEHIEECREVLNDAEEDT